jgi:hypothetical protein
MNIKPGRKKHRKKAKIKKINRTKNTIQLILFFVNFFAFFVCLPRLFLPFKKPSQFETAAQLPLKFSLFVIDIFVFTVP